MLLIRRSTKHFRASGEAILGTQRYFSKHVLIFFSPPAVGARQTWTRQTDPRRGGPMSGMSALPGPGEPAPGKQGPSRKFPRE